MADYYTLLTSAGIAYETACKAAGVPIKLSQISVGDGGGTAYNPAATATALKREVWRGPLNALFQDEKNPSWLLAEVTIPPDVGGWYVREAGLWTDTGILYAIVKYPESFKPVLATSGSGKEFYIRTIFETSNAALVTLLIDDTVVKATRAWVTDYVAAELNKLDTKHSVRVATTTNITLSTVQTIDGVAVVAGDRVLVKDQTVAKDNGLYVVAMGPWSRAEDASIDAEVTSALQVAVEQGATQADSRWQLVTEGVIVLGTTALMFQNITYGFAPLASPALVGVPTAPTAAPGANTAQIATTGFVQQEIAADLATAAPLMDGAAAVGTGSKLAREDHRHPTDTSRAPLASPALTGTPTAPTPGRFDVTTKLATMAAVQARGLQYASVTGFVGATPGVLAHVGGIVHCSSGPNSSYSLPDSAVNALAIGATVRIQNWSVLAIALAAQGTDKMQEAISVVASNSVRSIPPDTYVDAIYIGGGVWVLAGTGVMGKTAPFAALLSISGYIRFPSGLILQWMPISTTVFSNGYNYATLPIAFPSNILSVMISAVPGPSGIFGADAYSLSQIRFSNSWSSVQSGYAWVLGC
ncbi:phage tail protein [Pseudomonas sp. GW101-3H06]|uniref:phage tail protein n=1 Tax=Pseudomonas sp. GW101-3H06 TaxID=2751347 RepID=UPI001A911E83|nr:phage tail protein [Pseudomonas sp. GW101-3H06]